MARQLERVILLPANKDVLFNNSVNKPISFYSWCKYHEEFLWRLLFNHTKYFWKYIHSKRYNKYILYEGSIWSVIRYGQKLGYKAILYPERSTDINSLRDQVQLMLKKKLILGLLEGDKLIDFQQAIKLYNINPHNSLFIAKDYDIIDRILKVYYPRNLLYSKTINHELPLGFKFIYWTKKHEGEAINEIQLNPRENINSLLKHYEFTRYLYSARTFPIFYNKIFYIETQISSSINDFIKKNLNWIQEQAKLKDCEFIYLPKIAKLKLTEDFFSEYLQYCYPQIQKKVTNQFFNILDHFSSWDITELLLEILNLPAFKTPALLRNRETVHTSDIGEYSVYPLDEADNINNQFNQYFESLQSASDTSGVRYSYIEYKDDGKADSKFEEEANKIVSDVLNKIEFLKSQGADSILAEIAVRLLDIIDGKNLQPVLSKNISLQLPEIKPELSHLKIEWTSKYYFEIILSDYGNMIVDMPRLPKALYYLFLKHPEGIMINSLSDYKEELHSIYSRISNLSDMQEIKANIERLVDPFDNSINVNCSRIKNAFLKVIDDQLARHYYITGYRNMPKSISLSQDLIKITKNY